MESKSRHNPDIGNVLKIGILVLGGFWLLGAWAKIASEGESGTKLHGVKFDKVYRLGDNMHISWDLNHRGPSEEVVLVFSVGEVPIYGQPIDTAPIQELRKNITLNADEKWRSYSIEHTWPLDNLPGRGFYTVTNYVLNSGGQIIDKQISPINMYAI